MSRHDSVLKLTITRFLLSDCLSQSASCLTREMPVESNDNDSRLSPVMSPNDLLENKQIYIQAKFKQVVSPPVSSLHRSPPAASQWRLCFLTHFYFYTYEWHMMNCHWLNCRSCMNQLKFWIQVTDNTSVPWLKYDVSRTFFLEM